MPYLGMKPPPHLIRDRDAAFGPVYIRRIYALFFIPFGRLPVQWAQALWFVIGMGVGTENMPAA
jgi:hypothetical protein